MASNDNKTYYFPWVRKGLGNSITELDTLGQGSGTVMTRPEVKIVTDFKVHGVEKKDENGKKIEQEPVKLSQKKTVRFVGPGDVLSVNPSAIMKVNPTPDSATFPVQFYPYVEFWESDFPWRYTPAKADDRKLRPWLALLVCKSSDISLTRPGVGLEYFTFKGDEDAYKALFLEPTELFKTAHAQGSEEDVADFSRIIALRNSDKLEANTRYTVMLVPTFEVGRLRGLGNDDISETAAQASAWEPTMAQQKIKHPFRPLEFPIYYKWNFTTAEDSFDELARKLQKYSSKKAGIVLDVTQMGEGLDYSSKDKGRKSIVMPAATTPMDATVEEPFPSPAKASEKKTYTNLKALLDNSPVFGENKSAILGKAFMGEGDPGDDDPMVVPPVYGARHVLATELCSPDKTKQWVDQINLDIHNRAAAGLGKKVVQNHQEELVNRAWKQVEAVKALNVLLYNRLVSMRANKSLWNKTVGSYGDNEQFIAGMLNYLSTMKNAGGDVSLSQIMKDKRIPEGFASASFRKLSDSVARKVGNLDSTTLLENIVKNQTFEIESKKHQNLHSLDELRKVSDELTDVVYSWVVACTSSPLYGCISLDDKREFAPVDRVAQANLDMKSSGTVKMRFSGVATKDVWKKLKEASVKDNVIMSLLADVYSKEFSRYDFLGISDYYFYTEGNITRIDSETYTKWFGVSKPITIMGSGETAVYFVNEGRCPELLSAHKGGAFSSHALKFPGKVQNASEAVFFADGNFDWGYLEDKFKGGLTEGEFIIIDTSVLGSSECQTFKTLAEYVEFLKKPEDGMVQVVKSLFEMDAMLKELEKQAGKKTTPLEIEVDPNGEKPRELAKNLQNEEAYESMVAVAQAYYSIFFSDTSAGKKLRDEYIDELLTSKYPIIAYPIFPEPTFHYLKMVGQNFVLPGAAEIPEDTVSMVMSNPVFEESYLCGMNTEMGQELLWREYPTDQRGSYFRKFWDSETDKDSIIGGRFFDIKTVHSWDKPLGGNHMAGKDGLLIFAVKGKLMRMYPSTDIRLKKAVLAGTRKVDFDADDSKDILPVMQSFLSEDIFLVGFKVSLDKIVGNPTEKDYGYILTFTEHVDDLNFDSTVPIGGFGDSASVAKGIVNKPNRFGKHISLFLAD